jgi:hypothetical protein
MRIAIVSLFLFSCIAFSHPEDIGTATYDNIARVEHDGDFIEFSLELSSRCYQGPQEARNRVVQNVDIITQWLTETSANDDAILDYSVDLISVGRYFDRGYPTDDGWHCPGHYFAQQSIKITLHKVDGALSLDEDVILNFFNGLQIATGQLNYNEAENSGAEAKIVSIYKGISEETGEILRLAAKEKAKQKATRDFLAFLGSDYSGYWYLHSIRINDVDHGQYYMPVPFGGQIGNAPIFGPGGPILSTIKLDPVVISVTGTFVFHFQTTEHHLPPPTYVTRPSEGFNNAERLLNS